MRPVVARTTQALPTSPVVALDFYGRPQVSLQVVISGTATVVVEQTLDDVQNMASGAITWFPHPDTLLASTSINAQGNYAYVPRAVRMRQTAGSGSAALTVLQAGIG